MINLNDRGAELEGTTLIHPDGFDDLREALQENLKPFSEKNLEDLKRKKGISEAGLTQILTMLATNAIKYGKSYLRMKNRYSKIYRKL